VTRLGGGIENEEDKVEEGGEGEEAESNSDM